MDAKRLEEIRKVYEKMGWPLKSFQRFTIAGFDFVVPQFRPQIPPAAPEPQPPPRFLPAARYDYAKYLTTGALETFPSIGFVPSREDDFVFRCIRLEQGSPEPSRDPTRLVLTAEADEPDEPDEVAAPDSASARALRNAAAAADRAQDLRFGAQGFAAK